MIKYRPHWVLTKEGIGARLLMALSSFGQTFVTTPSERRAESSSPEPITSGGDFCPLRTSPSAAHGTSALDDSSRGLTAFHTPPTFKKNSTGERQRADGVEGRNGVSRSRGQESSPALARGRADRACELDGRRFESREGPEGVSREVAGSRLAGDPGESRRFAQTVGFGGFSVGEARPAEVQRFSKPWQHPATIRKSDGRQDRRFEAPTAADL
jgi:hypothetical protein